jgi:hypothetical protein
MRLTALLALALTLVAPSTRANWCTKGSDGELNSTSHCRTDLWDAGTPSTTDTYNAGFPKLPIAKRSIFYAGIEYNRTYAHHPMLLKVGPTVVLAHSSGLEDEDAQGMTVYGGVSQDGGYTWTESEEWLPRPLLPNQTYEYNLAYW